MLYVSIFILNVLDLIVTHIGVNIMGFHELNPLLRPLIDSWLIVPLKLGGAFFVAYGLYRLRGWRVARGVAWGIFTMYVLVVLWNGSNLYLG